MLLLQTGKKWRAQVRYTTECFCQLVSYAMLGVNAIHHSPSFKEFALIK